MVSAIPGFLTRSIRRRLLTAATTFWASVPGTRRLEQRTLHEELRTEQVVDGLLAGSLLLAQSPDVEQLPRVVPFVESLVGVDPLVALQADQLAPEGAGQGLRHLRLPDSRLFLEEDGPTE